VRLVTVQNPHHGFQYTALILQTIIYCPLNYFRVGFKVLTPVSTKMAVFWVVAQCSLVEVYQRFKGPCCLHHQGDEYAARVESVWDIGTSQPRQKPSGCFHMFAAASIIRWRSSSLVCTLVMWAISFVRLQKNNLRGVRYGDLGGQVIGSLRPIQQFS
jgi:hypothetical protein